MKNDDWSIIAALLTSTVLAYPQFVDEIAIVDKINTLVERIFNLYVASIKSPYCKIGPGCLLIFMDHFLRELECKFDRFTVDCLDNIQYICDEISRRETCDDEFIFDAILFSAIMEDEHHGPRDLECADVFLRIEFTCSKISKLIVNLCFLI